MTTRSGDYVMRVVSHRLLRAQQFTLKHRNLSNDADARRQLMTVARRLKSLREEIQEIREDT